jgi:hypothetical protein
MRKHNKKLIIYPIPQLIIVILIIKCKFTLKYFQVYYESSKTPPKWKIANFVKQVLFKSKTDKTNYWLTKVFLLFLSIKVTKCTGSFTCPPRQQEYQSIHTHASLVTANHNFLRKILSEFTSSHRMSTRNKRFTFNHYLPTTLSYVILPIVLDSIPWYGCFARLPFLNIDNLLFYLQSIL